MKLHSILLAIVIAPLSVGIVSAASHAPDYSAAITARQSQMRLFAFNLGTLGAMAQEKMPYDAEVAASAAANLATLTGLDTSAMWPAGSDTDNSENTRALPAIWQNFPDVGAKLQTLSGAAQAMAGAAGTDLASLQAAMGPLGAACGGCHKTYRAPE